MGRFYKTAKPTFVDDIIYQAPHELMAMALQNQDAIFEDVIEPLQGTEALFEGLDYVDKDSDYRQQKMKELNGVIEDLTQKAYDNPALARNLRGKINKARKDLEYSIKAGDFHLMDRNAKTRNKLVAEIQARTDIDDEQKKTAIDQLDFEFQGTNQGGVYKDSMHIYEKLDEEAFIKNKKAEMTADSIKTSENRTDGRYFTTESGERRFISDEKLDKLFEGSTGVSKWEKALLQKLDWQVQQGILNEEDEKDNSGNIIKKGRDTIFREARETFKNDFITSLGFEQKSDSTLLSTDGRDLREQENARAWGRYKKEMEELEETGRVIIERDEIPVPDSNLTEEDLDNKKYNESSEKLKTKIRERLKASGKFNTEVKNTGMGPHLQPDGTIVVDEEALNQAVEKENNRIRSILKSNNIDAKRALKSQYSGPLLADVLNFETRKSQTYSRDLINEYDLSEKNLTTNVFPTIPVDHQGGIRYISETGETVYKNGSMEEFNNKIEEITAVKQAVEEPMTVTGKELIAAGRQKSYDTTIDPNETYAAYETDGEILPITTKDKKLVANKDYVDGISPKKRGVKKSKDIVGVSKPFDKFKEMKVTFSPILKYENIVQTPDKSKVMMTYHVNSSKGRVEYSIPIKIGPNKEIIILDNK